jgi:hypothetical protein
VPTIIGKMPVVAGSNMSFFGIVETKRHDNPASHGKPRIGQHHRQNGENEKRGQPGESR